MGEPIWTSVHVKAPTEPTAEMAAVLGELADLIEDERDEDAHDDGTTMHRFSGESNYGLNEDVREALDKLQQLGLPYWACDEPKWGMPGSWVRWDALHDSNGVRLNVGHPIVSCYDGSGKRCGAYDGEGAVITADEVTRITNECKQLPPTWIDRTILARIRLALDMDAPWLDDPAITVPLPQTASRG